jgi:DNA-binding NtrC family response regulator
VYLATNRTRSVLDEQAIQTIRDTLRRHGGNVRQTALELRVPYRTLTERISGFGLRPELNRMRRAKLKAAAAKTAAA